VAVTRGAAPVRVLCILNGGPEHPSTRFRVLQHVDALRRRGIEPDLLVAKRGHGYGLLGLGRRAQAAHAVLLQKKLFASWKLAALPRRVPILFDFDDALFETGPDEEERYGPARAARRLHARRARLRAALARAHTVIAGNRFLADYAGAAAARVVVLPTAVDLAPFPEESVRRAAEMRRARGAERRIGWIGSRASLRYLAGLAEPLRAVTQRVPGARLVQVCNDFIDLPGVPVEKRVWSAEREAADLLDLDVGLMPIDDRPFSRGKCGLKILQYQAAGVPVVCSPVGANLEIVRRDETGLFAGDDREWAGAIERLLTDHAAAARIGAAGRASVATRYAAPVIGARLADLLLAAARGTASGDPAAADPLARGSGRDQLPVEEPEGDQ
jgi:glycosyltransferase involved in cell wall biosynthesis